MLLKSDLFNEKIIENKLIKLKKDQEFIKN